MKARDLTDVESHFAFGENWAAFAEGVDEAAIREAEAGLLKLVDQARLEGRSFLDIGCGSGLHSLAAARLGAAPVRAADIDRRSVATARALLERHAPGVPWSAEEISVFEMDPDQMGRFEIVYSWGVLHHTGDLSEALRRAAAMVAPGGLFVFALYRRTRLDPFWIREKRWYAGASARAQRLAHGAYLGLLRLGLMATGRGYRDHERTYRSRRGMSLHHDIHDWLGGYPYEPISAGEVDALLRPLGLAPVRCDARPTSFGLLGSGCDEFVYERAKSDAGRTSG